MIDCEVVGTKFIGYLDTGLMGELHITPSSFNQLVKKKILQRQGEHYLLKKFKIKRFRIPVLENINIIESDMNRIGLGYYFLKNYITIWNYNDMKIELLKITDQ